MLSSKCPLCESKKSRFFKDQKTEVLYSMTGKIP